MIDGVQFTYNTESKTITKLPIWEVLINEQTGKKVNDLRNANFRAMYLQLKPCANGAGFNLVGNGSLHKWFNCGEHNNNDFSFISLCDTINSLTSALHIAPQQCYLHGLEIGLNITLPYSALRVIKNLVCYKGKPFTQINKRNLHKGLMCSLCEYDIKLYDKAAQSKKQGGNVLRFELHLHKMRVVKNYTINTLADLQTPAKVYALKQLLFDVLGQIIWTDCSIELSRLSNREQKQWLYLCNANSWQTMNKRKAYRERLKAEKLINKFGTNTNIKPFINDTWEQLFFDVLNEIKAPKKRDYFTGTKHQKEAPKNGTISQLECCVKKSHVLEQKTTLEITTFFDENSCNNSEYKKCENNTIFFAEKNGKQNENIKNVRCCKSCGKDITNQHHKSIFCSERLHGKLAKKCRNKNSNTRRLKKDKIKKAMQTQNFIAVTYTEQNKTYTDTLHPTEIMLQKDWIDKVERVEVLPTLYGETPTTLTGSEAKNYMQQFLTNQ